MIKYRNHTQHRAALLVEVLVAVVMVAMVGMGIIGTITYGARAQENMIEDNGATRVAAEAVEQLRRVPLYTVQPIVNEPIVVNGEVAGALNLSLYQVTWPSGQFTKTAITAIQPNERILVLAEVVVTWKPAGRGSGLPERITLETLLAP